MGNLLSIAFTALRGALPLLGGFFTGGLSWVWSAVAAFVGTEIGTKIMIGLACALGGYVYGFSHEHAEKMRAVEAAIELTTKSRDNEWSKKLEQANAEVDARVQSAVAAAKAVPSAAPLSDAELLRRCAASEACRSKIAARRRVQSHPVSNVGSRR